MKKLKLNNVFSKSNIDGFSETCIGKATVGGGMGYITGCLFGILFTNISKPPTITEAVSLRSHMRHIVRTAHKTGLNIGKFTFLYNGIECAVEKYRAKSDLMSSVITGCGTGTLISIKNGPKSMLSSCVILSAFSTALDYYGSI